MEAKRIKLEPGLEQQDHELRFLQLLQEHADGVSQQFVQANVLGIQVKQILKVVNDLEKQNRLETLQASNGKLIWRLRSQESADKMSTMDAMERTVYQAILAAKDQGMTVSQLRGATKAPQKEVQRILKALEERKEVKALKPQSGRTKLYFAADITPSSSLTTQSPFLDGDGVDQDFVDILTQECLHYLERKNDLAKNKTEGPLVRRNASYASADEVQQHIAALKISKIVLSVADVASLLDALALEGRLESSTRVVTKTEAAEGSVDLDTGSRPDLIYRMASTLPESGLAKVPCGICPVRRDCTPGGIISPERCVYMKEWLSF